MDFLFGLTAGFMVGLLTISIHFYNIGDSMYNEAVMDCKENNPICEATYQKVMAERNLSAIISETNK